MQIVRLDVAKQNVRSSSVHSDCSTCRTLNQCLARDLFDHDMHAFMDIVSFDVKVAKGSNLFQQGDPLLNLYIIKLGHFKSSQVDKSGTHRVVGFHMSGSLLGLDSLDSGVYQSKLTALEDSVVCTVSLEKLESLFRNIPSLQYRFNRMMSEEIKLDKAFLFLLSKGISTQRIAHFLIDQSEQFSDRGFSKNTFLLRMTRLDIGNYLGMTCESISRSLMQLKNKDVIAITNREINILNMDELQNIANGKMSAS